MSEQECACYLSVLPAELLLNILYHVDLITLRCSVPRVCSRFRAIAGAGSALLSDAYEHDSRKFEGDGDSGEIELHPLFSDNSLLVIKYDVAASGIKYRERIGPESIGVAVPWEDGGFLPISRTPFADDAVIKRCDNVYVTLRYADRERSKGEVGFGLWAQPQSTEVTLRQFARFAGIWLTAEPDHIGSAEAGTARAVQLFEQADSRVAKFDGKRNGAMWLYIHAGLHPQFSIC